MRPWQISRNGGLPACLGYRGYTKTLCISPNHVVCHGIPGDRTLREGDIVNIDHTVVVDGWYGDSSRMFGVGEVAPRAKRLIEITYEALQRGTADGAIFPWAAFQPYRLAEVTSYHVDAELGGGPGAIIMSRKRYDALSAEARKAIDDNTQEPQSRVWATAFDEEAKKQRDTVKASASHTIVQLPPDQAIKQMADKMRQILKG